ncbi:protein translocase subunit SecD [Robiginitomaculum antarcticum]|uniref:protein translocase subunit SecD n=1 Tax=Robiginitomaculum antarcticum TaxID=437507 RepID=UPI000381FE78|nr:protein translocase subunit SecD [Robiginitomaculum antarcticum]
MLYFSRFKIIMITIALLLGIILAAPNLLNEQTRESLPGFLPKETINLGLDLQGGAHMLLEVDIDDVMNRVLTNELSAVKLSLREAKIIATNITQDGKTITGRVAKAEDIGPAMTAMGDLAVSIKDNQIGGAKTLKIEQVGERGFRITPTEDYVDDIKKRTVDQSIDVLRNRIDPTGTTEMTLAPEGDSRILLQVPGAKNVGEIKARIEDTANMSFHLVREADENELRRAVDQGKVRPLHILKFDDGGVPYILKERPEVTGEDLKNSSAGLHPEGGYAIVNFTFNTKGAVAFGRTTSNNLGKRFAVVLDDVVISAPRINGAILGGRGFIEGDFTSESARELSLLLNAGALPAKLVVVEEQTVGAELGEDSIRAGKVAASVGLLGVAIFMFFMYGFRFGLFANLALTFNIILIAAALSLLGATLTLPGIAGIILTIGMAVDANVLIFERIREEAANGRPPLNAIDTGYRLSMAPILDANITTLIAAATLYFVGSGPIRGFAVTLMIGIVMSVFTAVIVARLFTSIWHKRARPKTLPI